MIREEKRDGATMKEPTTTEMAAWAEEARRYVEALKEALELCRADRGHYKAIVHEHEQEWGYEESLRDQVEGLSIRNAELVIECKKLKAKAGVS